MQYNNVIIILFHIVGVSGYTGIIIILLSIFNYVKYKVTIFSAYKNITFPSAPQATYCKSQTIFRNVTKMHKSPLDVSNGLVNLW